MDILDSWSSSSAQYDNGNTANVISEQHDLNGSIIVINITNESLAARVCNTLWLPRLHLIPM